VVALCVKPAQMESVVRDVASELRDGTLLISVAASVSTQAIEDWTGGGFPVVRAMPNMPCRIGGGMTALAAGSVATLEHMELAHDLGARTRRRRKGLGKLKNHRGHHPRRCDRLRPPPGGSRLRQT
jgi:pyrroline-5-carboxylate reductase